ncbi:MAG: ABC transporter permease [Ilumatobacteraceae bacterium]
MDIIRYILRRMVLSAFVVVGVTFLVFIVAQVVPSDPAALYAGPRPTAEQIEKARQELNLGCAAARPLRDLRPRRWPSGDFGVSYKSRRLIAEDLKAYLPATLELAVFSTGMALLFGVPLGVMAAARQGRWPDRLGSLGAIASVAMPTFFLAMLLQLVFAQWLGIMPLSGRISREIAIVDAGAAGDRLPSARQPAGLAPRRLRRCGAASGAAGADAGLLSRRGGDAADAVGDDRDP